MESEQLAAAPGRGKGVERVSRATAPGACFCVRARVTLTATGTNGRTWRLKERGSVLTDEGQREEMEVEAERYVKARFNTLLDYTYDVVEIFSWRNTLIVDTKGEDEEGEAMAPDTGRHYRRTVARISDL